MRLQKLLILLFLFFTVFSAANAEQFIQLKKYYQTNCQDYTGTWQGFFTNPTDLFGNGGPWPIKVSLYNEGANIIGETDAHSAPSYVSGAMSGKIWAQCNNGQLSNIFLGKKNQCGMFSQAGLLVSKNVLVLQINYENAMTDAPIILFLKRVNSGVKSNLSNLAKNSEDLQLKSVQSCH